MSTSMRCGEHFELEAALDGGGPSQAPRRAASQPPRDPPRRPGTPHSPPPPRHPDRLFRSRVGDGVRAIAARGRVPLCQPPYYPRPGWACASHPIIHAPGWSCRVGQAVRIRSTYERGWRLLASHSHACRRAALTYYIPIYTHGIIVNDACCNARARGLCESWRCGGVSCQSKQSLHLRRHRGDPGHTRDRQTRRKLISS